MSTPQFPQIGDDPTNQQIKDYLIQIQESLQWLLKNIDNKNIKVNSLDAVAIKALSITVDLIAANSITADKMDVSELSAIAANLGTVTAGIIYGAYIATANGTYPRIEFSSAGNLLKALLDATDYIAINPGIAPFLLSPTIEFVSPSTVSTIGNNNFFVPAFEILSNKIIGIISQQNILLSAPSGNVGATSAAGSITDIVTTINSKATTGASTSGYIEGNHDHGIPDGTQLLDADGVTVWTWNAGGGFTHSHTV